MTSEKPNLLDVEKEANDGTASVAGSAKAEGNAARRGKRTKKDKEASLDVDLDGIRPVYLASQGSSDLSFGSRRSIHTLSLPTWQEACQSVYLPRKVSSHFSYESEWLY